MVACKGEERLHLEPQMIKIVEWVEKLEELELDFSKGEVYSTVSFSMINAGTPLVAA